MYRNCRCLLPRMRNILSARTYSKQQTHYEILDLKSNCTAEEIRNSFLKLSKRYHPDVQGTFNDPKKTAHFVKINEAYNVLSKKRSRDLYDLSLYSSHNTTSSPRSEDYTASWRHFHSPDPNQNPGPYYGVKGIKKMSNMKIVIILLVFATVGTAFEFFLVRNSLTFRRNRLDELSKLSGEQHASARADAIKYGNQKQIERIAERMIRSTGQ